MSEPSKWSFSFYLPGWFVSQRKRDALAARAIATGKARETRTWLGGFVEVSVIAEISGEPTENQVENTR